ncbi:cytochrome aa3 quinol oxidase subunit 4 [Seinonella peptonophila]|uniref:Quinol oxidase subunit 4 n=1 Tax=Seinonella peptonophila TaxID=112248 RepID=A0A1M4T667_9BACL|nr:cytochrome aa3 quinol oxidase subunit IV [Seinonella peptonophila]SHE39807.1 cytochrome aa3 quinol oxidase subunit 4 [Seinonella peptonophila]
MDNQKQNSSLVDNRFPWKHFVGYLLSVVLTLMALWITFSSGFSLSIIFAIIIVLAILQAVLQLLMFMHITERNSKIQTGTMLYAAFIAITIVAGSIWVMSAGHAAH